MKAQALAIAMVVASGVAMFVMYLSTFSSLRATQQSYYEQQRFADVFASLRRAPLSLAADVAAIPGVSAVEARVVANVTLDLEGMVEPATGRLVSIPATRRPRVDDLFVRRGRWIEPGRSDEVLASEAFVIAHGLAPGDHVRAVINGRLRRLTIVGVALSPEFIYSIRPGELIPDDRRFGIFWMERQALASAFDMEGGFNDLALDLGAGDVERSRRGTARPPARAVWRPRRHPARAAALALDRRERARSAAKFRVPAPAHLSHRGGLHPQRGPHPRARAAAAADCGAQGAGLQQPRARVALPEVGARHRRHRCGRSECSAAQGWAARSSICTTSTSAFPSCSSACRPEWSPVRRR